jgi:hypothetical protein
MRVFGGVGAGASYRSLISDWCMVPAVISATSGHRRTPLQWIVADKLRQAGRRVVEAAEPARNLHLSEGKRAGPIEIRYGRAGRRLRLTGGAA